MCDLYTRILSLCEARKITGYRLCKDCGISPSIMTDLKNGRKQTLSASNAVKISDYFGMSVNDLLSDKVEKEKPAVDDDSELLEYLEMLRTRPECRMLMSTVNGATKEQVEANVKFLESLRK